MKLNQWRPVVGSVGLFALSAYLCWDIAFGSRSERSRTSEIVSKNVQQKVDAMTRAPVALAKSRVPAEVMETTAKSGSPLDEQYGPVGRAERAKARAQRRSETLATFFGSQPRDGWAAETEIELRQVTGLQGAVMEQVSCRAKLCLVIASGSDRSQVMEAMSIVGTDRRMKMFSRLVSDVDGKATVEAFMSPSGTKWPQPQFDEG